MEMMQLDYMIINSLKDVDWAQFNGDDMIGLDIDDTLLTESVSLLRPTHRLQRRDIIHKLPIKDRASYLSALHNRSHLIPIEDDVVLTLHRIKLYGAVTFGFTARRTGYPNRKSTMSSQQHLSAVLNSIGIKFTVNVRDTSFNNMKPSLSYIDYVIQPTISKYYIEECAMLFEGTLYTNNIDKGIVLPHFLELLPMYPRKLAIVDDKISNLLSVSLAVDAINEQLHKNEHIDLYLYLYIGTRDTALI